ncbi:MAG: beta-galactosidase GalA [Asticcacaulis sp.]|uniref:beta-galactosidase GalA n=1 Tax=Asticcacaulis sp. TaxID=1872648 RepID=UPI003F7C8E88
MNRRELFKTISATAFVSGFSGIARAQVATPTASPRQVLSLDKGWRFHEGDIPMPLLVTHQETYEAAKAGKGPGAADVKYDDSAWPRVTLPHDFAIAQPFDKNANVDQAYRPRGVAWYRNTLLFTQADHGRHIELQLDGMATFATVWFNGTLVDRNWSGYQSAYIDLTPYAYYDKPNQLAIRVDATAMEGWWYEGAGLYRHAWIVKRDPVHIVTDGVFAHPVKTGDTWTIPVEVTLNNSGDKTAQVTVTSELRDAGGKALATVRAQAACDPLGQGVVNMTLPISFTPDLWSPETPVIYSVATRIEQGGRVLDEVTTPCGFRTTRWDADQGFFLNDRHVKIKGVCLHQDHAGVGTAIPENVIDYRLKRLKTLGCNAIRFSHNAQNTYLMHACDRMGFLVMAENRNFDASPDYIAQLQWLVRRDRNHPSIYLWSVFNEEPMQATEQGYEMVRRMSAAVKALDATRPVTAAMNGGLDAAISVAEAVDVVGINYQQDKYDLFHKAHPDKPMFSSEDTSAFMTRGEYKSDQDKHIMASYDDEAAPWGETQRDAWQAVVERPFVGGQFVWTGLDYHGEPSPFTWPSNSSYFGILDLCGFDKAAAFIHRAQWIDDTPQLGLVPHWNWQAGNKVRVMACTNADEVELFVNGQSAGRQKGDRLRMNYWTLDYAPGFIEARAYKGGKLVAKARNETTGKAVALRLTPDLDALTANGRDAAPVKVEAIDAKGRNVPLAQDRVTFAIEGGTIIGLGNGDPTCLEPEKGSQRSLFNGLAQVIVQAGATAGALTLTASADGLKPASVAIKLNPGCFTAPWRAPGEIADQATA